MSRLSGWRDISRPYRKQEITPPRMEWHLIDLSKKDLRLISIR